MLPERSRFLVLTPAIDGSDGISEVSRQVTRALADEAGVDAVEVWAFDGGPAGTGDGAPRFRSAGRSPLRLARWALARALRAADMTVVVMHAQLAPVASLLALGGARVAAFLIGVEVWQRLRRRERYALEHADRVLSISRHTERRFRAANPAVRVPSVTVCAPGIGPRPPAAPTIDHGFALIVGRLSSEERYKGHDWLIDVWPAVRDRVPDASLLIVGDGDDRRRLQARVSSCGLDGAIRFTGRVSDQTLAGLYGACAFFVMPSTGEGFGLAYLEAMRAGKPCIAAHGAADEIVEDGLSGLLVDEGRSSRLIDACVRLFSDRDLRVRMGAAAEACVARQFTEQHFARRFRAALGLPAGSAPAVRASVASVR